MRRGGPRSGGEVVLGIRFPPRIAWQATLRMTNNTEKLMKCAEQPYINYKSIKRQVVKSYKILKNYNLIVHSNCSNIDWEFLY